MKTVLLMFIFFSLTVSCHHAVNKPDTIENRCEQVNEDSVITLKGILNISSKGTMVFENVNKRNEWQRKIHLIPCCRELQEYVLQSYDSYLYVKNFDDQFWVSVGGKYLMSDTLEHPQEFLFCFVGLIDELEAITDSSQAMRTTTQEFRHFIQH